MTKPITQKVGERLRRAAEQASEFKSTYQKALPLVERNSLELEKLVLDLETLARTGRTLLGEVQVLHGYMQEGAEIATDHWDEMAQATTLAINLDVFFRGDVAQVEHVLSLTDRAVLEDAFGNLAPERLLAIEKALARAVAARPDEMKEANDDSNS